MVSHCSIFLMFFLFNFPQTSQEAVDNSLLTVKIKESLTIDPEKHEGNKKEIMSQTGKILF